MQVTEKTPVYYWVSFLIFVVVLFALSKVLGAPEQLLRPGVKAVETPKIEARTVVVPAPEQKTPATPEAPAVEEKKAVEEEAKGWN